MYLNKNLIFIGILVLVLIVTGFLLFGGEKIESITSFLNPGVSNEAIAKKAVDYLNSNILQDARKANLLGFSQESGVIKINIKIGDNSYNSYVTKDGKIIFPEGIIVDLKSENSLNNQNNTGDKNLENIRPISQDDHIRGNIDAQVAIVEYSDLECPFCKQFHVTLKQIFSEYSNEGKVAWVYRHFPLDQLHSKARKEAVASECVFELGGKDAFWKFVDRFYEITPSNNQTNIDTVLPQIAREIGIDENKFNTCLNSNKYDAKIQSDVDNAQATGGSGTPWSVIVSKNGKKYPLSGSQSYENVKQLVEQALSGQ